MADPLAQSQAMIASLSEGTRVRRNPANWVRGDEDGGDGSGGSVVNVDRMGGFVTVRWDASGEEYSYRMNYNFELIITGNENRWLTMEDFPAGMRVVHDFRGPGVVTGVSKKDGVQKVEVQFDAGDSHGYKESALCNGKLQPDPDNKKAFTQQANLIPAMVQTMIASMSEGSRVRRNPDTWAHGNDDGGDGCLGSVTDVDYKKGWVSVQWDNGGQGKYRLDCKLELIICGNSNRWLSSDDFPAGMRVVHDFRGPGVVTKLENKQGVTVVRVLFDAGDSHGYKESALCNGKLQPDPDELHKPREYPIAGLPTVQTFEDAVDLAAQVVEELGKKGVQQPANSTTPDEARASAKWLLQQLPKHWDACRDAIESPRASAAPRAASQQPVQQQQLATPAAEDVKPQPQEEQRGGAQPAGEWTEEEGKRSLDALCGEAARRYAAQEQGAPPAREDVSPRRLAKYTGVHDPAAGTYHVADIEQKLGEAPAHVSPPPNHPAHPLYSTQPGSPDRALYRAMHINSAAGGLPAEAAHQYMGRTA